jgi:hypothetical protein
MATSKTIHWRKIVRHVRASPSTRLEDEREVIMKMSFKEVNNFFYNHNSFPVFYRAAPAGLRGKPPMQWEQRLRLAVVPSQARLRRDAYTGLIGTPTKLSLGAF